MEAARPTFHNLPPEKQDRVLSAALGEFSDKGYQQASVNTMVSASGIAKGSIYQYFKDKKSLFLYIFDFAIGMVRRTLLAVKEETRDEDFFVRLEKSLVAGVAFSTAPQGVRPVPEDPLRPARAPAPGTPGGGAPCRGIPGVAGATGSGTG